MLTLLAVTEPRSATVQYTVDAFIEAVEAGRRELTRREGREVSVRALIRRAGFDDNQRAGVFYHLNPNIERKRGHDVPPWLVEALERVLPVQPGELARAARIARGFNVVDEQPAPDVASVVMRFYESQDVTEADKAAVTARLLQIINEEMQREHDR